LSAIDAKQMPRNGKHDFPARLDSSSDGKPMTRQK